VEWFGHLEVRKVAFPHGVDLIDRLMKLNLANSTVNHHLVAAKGVLNHAIECKRISTNPWKKIGSCVLRCKSVVSGAFS
jgi:hypothetical protein